MKPIKVLSSANYLPLVVVVLMSSLQQLVSAGYGYGAEQKRLHLVDCARQPHLAICEDIVDCTLNPYHPACFEWSPGMGGRGVYGISGMTNRRPISRRHICDVFPDLPRCRGGDEWRGSMGRQQQPQQRGGKYPRSMSQAREDQFLSDEVTTQETTEEIIEENQAADNQASSDEEQRKHTGVDRRIPWWFGRAWNRRRG